MNLLRLFLPILLTLPVLAQEPLSVEQAVHRALAHSPQIHAAEARERAAEYAFREAIGYRLPSVQLTEMAVRTANPAEAFAFRMNQERFSMSEFADPANDPNNPGASNTYMTRAEATLPLFTGGMLSARMGQAKLMLEAARAERERAAEEVAFKTIEAWLNLARGRENLDLMRRSLETARAHLRQAREYRDAGLIVPSDVMRAEVFVSELEEWQSRAENGERLAQAALNFAMGAPQSNDYRLMGLDPAAQSSPDLGTWMVSADRRRPDLRAAHLKVKAAARETHVARAAFLPEIGLVGRYDFYDDRLFGDHGESWSLMGVAKWNIFRGGADYHGWQRQRQAARAHASDAARFREGVALEVRQAHGQLQSSQFRQSSASKALQSGRENLRIVEERYAQGIVKVTDLLDAQTALRELEVRELEARYDHHLAWYRLRLAAGESLKELTSEEE